MRIQLVTVTLEAPEIRLEDALLRSGITVEPPAQWSIVCHRAAPCKSRG